MPRTSAQVSRWAFASAISSAIASAIALTSFGAIAQSPAGTAAGGTPAAHAPAVPFAPPPQVPYGLAIELDAAKAVAAGAVAEAKKNKWNMAIAIVDTAGYLVYFEKMSNTQTGSVQLAIEKAQTSALFRRPSKVFQDGVAAGGEGLRLLRLTGSIPIEGGLPIVQDGKIVGAIGVSGGSGAQDQQTAQAGLTAK